MSSHRYTPSILFVSGFATFSPIKAIFTMIDLRLSVPCATACNTDPCLEYKAKSLANTSCKFCQEVLSTFTINLTESTLDCLLALKRQALFFQSQFNYNNGGKKEGNERKMVVFPKRATIALQKCHDQGLLEQSGYIHTGCSIYDIKFQKALLSNYNAIYKL